jgi:hypothetical protein
MFGKHGRPDPETAEHVYEVDGLTRSLTDLAKLVELLDAHELSFVSVADCPECAPILRCSNESHFRAHWGQDRGLQVHMALSRLRPSRWQRA